MGFWCPLPSSIKNRKGPEDNRGDEDKTRVFQLRACRGCQLIYYVVGPEKQRAPVAPLHRLYICMHADRLLR